MKKVLKDGVLYDILSLAFNEIEEAVKNVQYAIYEAKNGIDYSTKDKKR